VSHRGLASILAHKRPTLNRNRARSAAFPVSTGTIPTTRSRKQWSGFVSAATTRTTLASATACGTARRYRRSDIDPGAVDIARARLAFWTPERHRLELTNAAALRAEEKRQERAAQQGQLDIFGDSQ
jgi:hypothetical protein